MNYGTKSNAEQTGEIRNGLPIFYEILEIMATIHDEKSHDYASSDNPTGNYHFAGAMSKLFDNVEDAGFVARIGEKMYRLANIENNGKTGLTETIEENENDLCVIMTLWVADRRSRRMHNVKPTTPSRR